MADRYLAPKARWEAGHPTIKALVLSGGKPFSDDLVLMVMMSVSEAKPFDPETEPDGGVTLSVVWSAKGSVEWTNAWNNARPVRPRVRDADGGPTWTRSPIWNREWTEEVHLANLYAYLRVLFGIPSVIVSSLSVTQYMTILTAYRLLTDLKLLCTTDAYRHSAGYRYEHRERLSDQICDAPSVFKQ